MVNREEIAFRIWGALTKDTEEVLLESNSLKDTVELKKVGDKNIREICEHAEKGGAYFYSIEKTQNYTIVSVFNPDAIDFGKRLSYISILLFIKSNKNFGNEVLKTLTNLMDFYVEKQGSETRRCKIEANEFEEKLNEVIILDRNNQENFITEKLGCFVYNNELEVEQYFKTGNIGDYKRVFFINSENKKLQQIRDSHVFRDYGFCKDFKKYTQIKLINYSRNRHSIKLNNNPLPESDSDTFIYMALPYDTIRIYDNKTRSEKPFSIGNNNFEKDLQDEFRISIKPLTQSGKKNPLKTTLIVASLAIIISFCVYWIKSRDEIIIKNISPAVVSMDTSINLVDTSLEINKINLQAGNGNQIDKNKVFTTLELINEGCFVFARKFFSRKPYIKKKDGKWWQGKNESDAKEVKSVQDLKDIEDYFNNTTYYMVENNTYKFSPDKTKWTTLTKDDQPGIYKFFKEKGLITESEVSSNNTNENNDNKKDIEPVVAIPQGKDKGDDKNKVDADKCKAFKEKQQENRRDYGKCTNDDCKSDRDKELEDLKKAYPGCK